MSTEDRAGAESAAGGTAYEPLACVTCRSRKLKCDRVKPKCSRCVKVKGECIYPESRRKPAFKRRNVRELEARLAQVEGMLKDASGRPFPENDSPPEVDAEFVDLTGFQETGSAEQDVDFDLPDVSPNTGVEPGSHPPPGTFDFLPTGADRPPNAPFSWSDMPPAGPLPADGGNSANELLYLGLFEALPPYEMIEELHQSFFQKQYHFIPIVHPGRYLKAFYSAPHMRPPMALQYAIWTMAANGHEKYATYHDAFHRRARQYLYEDELKGSGEFFLTIQHAQAWALIATDEARCMWFTRAAMSSARCIKLIHMMGLHRLDDEFGAGEIAPTIAPAKDWTELEERRRILWGAFCIDSHASITTGWPTLIDYTEVTTHLPCSEEAFNQCKEEKASTLSEVFDGASYSAFAGTAIVCHIFNRILKHVHRPKPTDHPENPEYGPFWNRHREMDNLLSSTFMFLPERFRLPKNIRDPIAVSTNLNLHAAVICLHQAACEKSDEFNLRGDIKMVSKVRLLAAAQEIVNIVKVTSHINAGYRSPLVSLSIYCAALVYISHLKDVDEDPTSVSNIQFLVKAMDAMGKQHFITRAFLQQILLDIKENGVENKIVMTLPKPTGEIPPAPCGHNIPLFARSKVSRHTKMQPPLPGRLPLGNPIGRTIDTGQYAGGCPANLPVNLQEQRLEDALVAEPTSNNKRRRMKSPEAADSTTISLNQAAQGLDQRGTEQNAALNGFGPLNPNPKSPTGGPMFFNATAASQDISGGDSFFIPTSMPSGQDAVAPLYTRVLGHMKLPHRAGSDASSPSTSRTAGSTQAGSSSSATPGRSGPEMGPSGDGITPGQVPFTPLTAQAEADLFQGLDWGDMSGSVFESVADIIRPAPEDGSGDNDPWGLARDKPLWDTGGNG